MLGFSRFRRFLRRSLLRHLRTDDQRLGDSWSLVRCCLVVNRLFFGGLDVFWLLVGCWLGVGLLVGFFFLVVGRCGLVFNRLFFGWLVAGWLLVGSWLIGCRLVVGWLVVGWMLVGFWSVGSLVIVGWSFVVMVG